MRSTLIVGLDGATPELLFPAAASGELPVLGRLMREGGWGPLSSTVPPMTLPAWASFLTGAPPGRHGIFDFSVPDLPRRRLRFLDARDRELPTLAARASARENRVGMFFFPTTFPPEPLSGGCVSGFDSPVATRIPAAAFHPQSLHRRAVGWVGRELAYADFSELRKGPGWEEDAAAALLAGIEAKETFARRLLAEDGPYDLFGILFGEADTASHHFWHLHDPRSPRHDPSSASVGGDVVRSVYRRLDAAVGVLLDAQPWERVILASDHGFGGTSDRILHINAWLARHGFLRFLAAPSGGARRAVAAGLPNAWTAEVARRLPRRLLEQLEFRARFAHIDFASSRAWSEELEYAPAIRLLDPEAAEPLRRALADWRDPVDGECIVRAVQHRSEVHVGPHVERCPELLLELRRPGGYAYGVRRSGPSDAPVARLTPRERRGRKGDGMAGTHRPDGVWMTHGCGDAGGPERRAIADLAADVLDPDLGNVEAPSVVSRRTSVGALARRLQSLGYID